MMKLDLAFDEADKRLWAWIAVNLTIFIFFILFLHIYCLGKFQLKNAQQHPRKIMKVSNITIGENTNKDYKIFERLRLLCCFIMLSYSIWPFQFYISSDSLTDFEQLSIVSCSSLADLGVTFMIAIIAHRTFKSYHKIVRGMQLPTYYNVILITFVFINGLCSCVIEIMSYGLTNNLFDAMYNHWAYIYVSFEIILFITLFRFLLKIAIIFSKIYKYEKSRGIKTDAKELRMKRLYLRMVYLCGGLMIYSLMLIGCYTYFFIAGGKDITNEFWWIIIHEWLGHIVLYTTFYSYLRIKRFSNENEFEYETKNGYNNISGNKKIGAKLSITRSGKRSNSTNNHIRYLTTSKCVNPTKYSHINKGKYFQNSNDDFFADDDMSDLRRSHRNSQSDQTEIMSISATDEAGQHYNSYKNTTMQYSMMPYGQIPPVQSIISPNDNDNVSDINNKGLNDIKYENFVI